MDGTVGVGVCVVCEVYRYDSKKSLRPTTSSITHSRFLSEGVKSKTKTVYERPREPVKRMVKLDDSPTLLYYVRFKNRLTDLVVSTYYLRSLIIKI